MNQGNARMKVFVVVATLALLLILAWAFTSVAPLLGPKPTTQEIARRGSILIEKAGGPEQIAIEADQIFARFGTNEVTSLTQFDLTNYPHVAALGNDVVMFRGDPTYIGVRVGTHLNGFMIVILTTNNAGAFQNAGCAKLAQARGLRIVACH
jgi:hypothetical protein